jgi:hypothetical protein
VAKLRAGGTLPRKPLSKLADLVTALSVDNRAAERRAFSEAIDHGFNLAIVESATIAGKKISDCYAILEFRTSCPNIIYHN